VPHAVPLATRRPACGGVRVRRPLRLPAPAGLAAVGFARVSSTERRRADIKSGHFIELYCTFDTVAHPRHFARWARPHSTKDNAGLRTICAIARMLLSMRSQQSTLVSYLRSSTLYSHRRHLIRPNVGIRFLKRFRDASRGRAVPRPRSAGTAPRRAAVSRCVPCLIACALCAGYRAHMLRAPGVARREGHGRDTTHAHGHVGQDPAELSHRLHTHATRMSQRSSSFFARSARVNLRFRKHLLHRSCRFRRSSP